MSTITEAVAEGYEFGKIEGKYALVTDTTDMSINAIARGSDGMWLVPLIMPTDAPKDVILDDPRVRRALAGLV